MAPKKRDYPIVACADCGKDAKQANKMTKRCAGCRLARACAWHDGREATCGCGSAYIAWEGVRSNPRCGACFIAASPGGGRESVPGTCVECKQPGVVFTEMIHICYNCIYEPKNKEWVKASIARKYARLKAKHAARSSTPEVS